MAISIGVNAWVWTSPFTTDNEGLAVIDKAKQMGFDSFEFGLEDPSHVDPAKLKAKLQQTGLRLVVCGAFGPDRDLTHDDASVRDNSLNYITQAVKVCQRIYGLSFHWQQCLKEKRPIAYQAVPFELKGAYRKFRLVVTFYAKVPGSGGPYKQAGRVALKFSP